MPKHTWTRALIHWAESLVMQVGALCATFSLGVMAFILLHYTVGESWALVAMLNNFAHVLTLGCIPAFIVALLLPRYRIIWGLYALPGIGFFIIWYSPLFLPKPSMPFDNVEPGIEITVTTINIRHQRDRIEEVLSAFSTSDFIGVQEAAAIPATSSPPISDHTLAAYQAGKLIYSQHPMLEGSRQVVGDPGYVTETRDLLARVAHERRAWRIPVDAVAAQFEINNIPIMVYNMHPIRPTLDVRTLNYNDEERNAAIRYLSEALTESTTPVIVLCDCNFTYRTDDYARLATHLNDAWRVGGWGFGLTAPTRYGPTGFFTPLARVDYIWYSDHFELLSVAVLPMRISDHYPVQARLHLTAP